MRAADRVSCVVVAGPGRDGHRGVARLVAAMLDRAGTPALYAGVARDGAHAARIARRRGAEVVGVSLLAGGSVRAVAQAVAQLRAAGVAHLFLVVSGRLTPGEVTELARLGLAVFGPNGDTDAVCRHVRSVLATPRRLPLAA